jgi:hypothetical protein
MFDPAGEISPYPETHQLDLARHPGLLENAFEVGFRPRPGDAEHWGGPGQGASREQAGEHAGFRPASDQRRQPGRRHHALRSWHTDEHGGNGRGLRLRGISVKMVADANVPPIECKLSFGGLSPTIS